MSNIKQELVKVFEEEFNELDKYFINEIVSTIHPEIKTSFLSDYNLEKLNSFFCGKPNFFLKIPMTY